MLLLISGPGGEEILRIEASGFYWKGERVEDTLNVYGRFSEWLDTALIKNKVHSL